MTRIPIDPIGYVASSVSDRVSNRPKTAVFVCGGSGGRIRMWAYQAVQRYSPTSRDGHPCGDVPRSLCVEVYVKPSRRIELPR